MKPFIVLISVFILTNITTFFIRGAVDYSLAGRISMGVMLLFTAMAHFAFRKSMTKMVPAMLPYKEQIVVVTGLMEIAAALALLLSVYTEITGWAVIGLFICMLPANIYAAIHKIDYQKPEGTGPAATYLWFRIPLQLFFIVWVYQSTIGSLPL